MERVNKYKNIISLIQTAMSKTTLTNKVKLLVVSKKRTVDDIMCIYNLGHRDFGENYVNELIEKSEKLPSDINWHMIGHLQTNKCKKILSLKNLKIVESVDNLKLAQELNLVCSKLGRCIDIYIQINISNEDTKSGIKIENFYSLYEDIVNSCPYLNIAGIMSLGSIGSIEEFKIMYEIKSRVLDKYNKEIMISIGTSDDFEEAINQGSNEVRLGSIIFDNDY
jgi:pyridoxal phosphate enzyme (YggS family)